MQSLALTPGAVQWEWLLLLPLLAGVLGSVPVHRRPKDSPGLCSSVCLGSLLWSLWSSAGRAVCAWPSGFDSPPSCAYCTLVLAQGCYEDSREGEQVLCDLCGEGSLALCEPGGGLPSHLLHRPQFSGHTPSVCFKTLQYSSYGHSYLLMRLCIYSARVRSSL